MIAGTSCSVLRGERIVDLLTGGGDRSLGETGQRNVSLLSTGTEGFWAIGALIVGPDSTGCSLGVCAIDNALLVAAAEGGLAGVLFGREGLRSCVLLFLDLPGPAVERLGGLDLG